MVILETVTEIVSQSGNKLLVTACANPKIWQEYLAVGFAAATDERSDVSIVTFPSVSHNLGISVINHEGTFITAIHTGSDAWADGRLRVGDEILFVGNERTRLNEAGALV